MSSHNIRILISFNYNLFNLSLFPLYNCNIYSLFGDLNDTPFVNSALNEETVRQSLKWN